MSGHIGRPVSIIGASYALGDVRSTPGITGFSEKELLAKVSIEAMEDGGIDAKDIDAFYVGCSGPNANSKMKSAGTHFSEWIGLQGKPAVFHDEGCGTSAYGLQMAVQAVASGMFDCVISTAVNINLTTPYAGIPPFIRRLMPNSDLWDTIYTGTDSTYEKAGEGGAGCNEAYVIGYSKKHGIPLQKLEDGMIAYVEQKRNEALLNPKNTSVDITLEEEAKSFGFNSVHDYLTSNKYNPRMGSWLRAKFVGKTVDGASAVIVCASDIAKKYTKQPIRVAGVACDTELHKALTDVPVKSRVNMFKSAYAQAGITDPYKEIQFMGAHDCTTIVVATYGEEAGFFPEGKGIYYMLEGRCGYQGDRPVSTDGGRTQLGHPLAPAFNIEVAEAVDQMRGVAGARQIAEPPKSSLIWGGGSGWHMGCAVLQRED